MRETPEAPFWSPWLEVQAFPSCGRNRRGRAHYMSYSGHCVTASFMMDALLFSQNIPFILLVLFLSLVSELCQLILDSKVQM